jgi:hypothetical protein
MLLLLDAEEPSEAERVADGVASSKYLRSRARLKDRSTSSNSSRSLRRRGSCGMITYSKKKHKAKEHVGSSDRDGSEIQI